MKKYHLLLCFLFPLIVAGQQIDAKKLQKLWKKEAKQGKRKKRKNGVRD